MLNVLDMRRGINSDNVIGFSAIGAKLIVCGLVDMYALVCFVVAHVVIFSIVH